MEIDFFTLEKNGAKLFYLGVEHSWDPENPQFKSIKEKFAEFLGVAKNPLVILENRCPLVNATEQRAILHGSEICFMAFICRDAEVPVVCFEPDTGEEMNELAKEFSREKIEYYYFARIVAQWYRLKEKPEKESYISRFLERDKKASGWSNFVFSIANMREVHKKLFGTELDFEDEHFFRKIENPTRGDNPLKEVVRASGKIRDKMIIKKTIEAWEEGKDLFIVYGRGHLERHLELLKISLEPSGDKQDK